MSRQYLIDTVILIDHFKGISRASQWLSSLKAQEAVISVITLAEILSGALKEEEENIYFLLAGFECLSIGPSTAELAASLRQKWHFKLPDAFQAALALENQLLLVTRNTKDFSSRIHSFVKIPYAL